MRKFFLLFILLFLSTVLQFSLTQENTKLFYLQECSTCDAAKIEEFFVFIPQESRFFLKLFPADPDFVADVIWLKTAYYYGLVNSSDTGDFFYLPFLLDAITDLAPKWDFPYYFGGVTLLFETQMKMQGFKIIEKGMKHLPGLWELWLFKGIYYLKFEKDYEKASLFIAEASKKKDAPHYLAALSATIALKSENMEFVTALVERLKKSVKNEKILKNIINKL